MICHPPSIWSEPWKPVSIQLPLLTIMLVFIAGFSGCERKETPKEKTMSEVTQNSLGLECRFEESGTTLKIEARLTNSSTDDLLLFLPIGEFENGELIPKPKRVYTRVEGKRCIIQKLLFEVPDEIDVFMPEVPFLTLLPAGANLVDNIELPIALIESYPYQMMMGEVQGEEKVEIDEIVVRFGYITKDENLETLDSTDSGLFEMGYGEGITNQMMITSDPFQIDATVSVPLIK